MKPPAYLSQGVSLEIGDSSLGRVALLDACNADDYSDARPARLSALECRRLARALEEHAEHLESLPPPRTWADHLIPKVDKRTAMAAVPDRVERLTESVARDGAIVEVTLDPPRVRWTWRRKTGRRRWRSYACSTAKAKAALEIAKREMNWIDQLERLGMWSPKDT